LAIRAEGDRISRLEAGTADLVRRLVELACAGLPAMFRADRRVFAFTRKRGADGHLALAGESVRYGAIVLLGAQQLAPEAQRAIFAGESALEFCTRLLGGVEGMGNAADLALIAWAAAEAGHPAARTAFERLRRLGAFDRDGETVHVAWLLSAAVAGREHLDRRREIDAVAGRLLRLARPHGIFPHRTDPATGFSLRAHVGCFADQVYPIQALARYARAFGERRALAAAERCAERICELQGDAGQWWWHYDARTGDVVEGYPVYSVHQDAMAPMALLDLEEAGGRSFEEPIRRGLAWLVEAPETGRSLIDEPQQLIWRKVGRTDPAKLVRRARAALSSIAPERRLAPLDALFPATRIDWESRPYHLGWILYAWLSKLSV
jgi:hypothetical protein